MKPESRRYWISLPEAWASQEGRETILENISGRLFQKRNSILFDPENKGTKTLPESLSIIRNLFF
jgi:hypothetical protein